MLKTLGVLGIAGVSDIAARQMFAAPIARSSVKGGRIDVHHHHIPPALRQGSGGHNWTPELTLLMMDKFDIGLAMLSMTQMGDMSSMVRLSHT